MPPVIGDELLFNIYRMGKNSIERGSKDYWALSPKRIDAIDEAYKNDPKKVVPPTNAALAQYGMIPRGGGMPIKYYDTIMKAPVLRDPRGFIIPTNQPDFATAVKFVNALIQDWYSDSAGYCRLHRSGQEIPSGFLRRQDRSGVPAPPPGHVRAAGSPQRFPVSGWSAGTSLRCRWLDTRLPDER